MMHQPAIAAGLCFLRMLCRLLPNARVDRRGDDIAQQIAEHDAERRKQEAELRGRKVAAGYGVVHHLSHALPAEDDLDHHRAGEQPAQLHAQRCGIRHERVFKHMAKEHLVLTDALGACGEDVFLLPNLGDGAFHQHEITRRAEQNQNAQRQNHVLDDARRPRRAGKTGRNHAVDRHPLELVGERDEQQQTQAV